MTQSIPQKQRSGPFFKAGIIVKFYLLLCVWFPIFYSLHRKVPPQAGLFFDVKKSLKMALIENISEMASTILQSIDGYLVDVTVRGERGGSIVEVFVDTDNGVTADECAQINRYVSSEIEKQNLISGRYRLEVSSPGLDRPLKMVRQYKKNIGRQIKIVSSVDDQKSEGVLQNVNDTTLTLTTKEKLEKSFALNDIREAYVLPQFK